MTSRALILNASFEPLLIVSWRKAIQLLFQGKVEVIEDSEQIIRSVKFSMKVPAVLRLLTYIPINSRRQMVRFSRANIFLRDQLCCQYCNGAFSKNLLTLDHVIPIVQGGTKSWENIVTSCKICNQKKGGRTPKQAGMQLIRRPMRPSWLPDNEFQIGIHLVPTQWRSYLQIK